MLWTSRAIVLSARAFGEGKAIASVLSDEHGRYSGVVHGGSGKRRALLQPGTVVSATWRARTAEQLGVLTLEPQRGLDTQILGDRLRLASLAAACSLLDAALPEREPNRTLYAQTLALLESLVGGNADEQGVFAMYAAWEQCLVAELGFDLGPDGDRKVSIMSGNTGELTSSPAAAADLGERGRAASHPLVRQLRSTMAVLEANVFTTSPHRLPAARSRLADLIAHFSRE